MSKVRVVGATVGDIHARAQRPACRGEEDWGKVEVAYFKQLRSILDDHGNPPLFVAGDIFHKWNAPPEVINRVIKHFPDCYAVPGNHDLPYHNYKDIRKSAFWTLVQAGKVRLLEPGSVCDTGKLIVTGFPYGFPPARPPARYRAGHHVALIHAYCWAKGHTHPGAPEDQHVKEWVSRLKGYDGLVFGDNHQAFNFKEDDGPWVRNGGCFIRQSLSEVDVTPSVGLIMSDGYLDSVDLDTSADIIREDAEAAEDLEGFGEVIEELTKLEKTHIDFEAAVRRAVRSVPPRVKALVLKYLGEDK
jgi:3',5'-cyclic AMP phosphodiesterase CpdA